MARKAIKPLTRVSDIHVFCRSNDVPITVAGATPFGCLGLDGYFGQLHFVSALDCVLGMDRSAFAPEGQRQAVFQDPVEACNDLLRHPEVSQHIKSRGPGLLWPASSDVVTETLASELGVTLAITPYPLRSVLANRDSCRELLAKAGVPFVPSITGEITSTQDVIDLAGKAKLGTDLVLQFAGADGSKITAFVSKPKDLDKIAEAVSGKSILISKFIEHNTISIEGVVTDAGILLGPILEMHRGEDWIGACAASTHMDSFRPSITASAKKLGAALHAQKFLGAFTATFYAETETGKVFLRQISPSLTPFSQLTHLLTSNFGGLPLHAFHLLAFMDVPLDIDTSALAKRWSEHDSWSMVVPLHQGDGMEFMTKSPASSIYKLDQGGEAEIVAPSINPLDVQGLDECLYLRTLGTGTYRQKGLELGLILLRDDAFSDGRAARWVKAMASQFSTVHMSGTSLPSRGKQDQRVTLFS
jgi:hypothetical protein